MLIECPPPVSRRASGKNYPEWMDARYGYRLLLYSRKLPVWKGNDNETLMRLVQKLMCKWGNEHGKANVQALSLERSTVGEQQRTKLHGGVLFAEHANCRSLFFFLWTIGSTLQSLHCLVVCVKYVLSSEKHAVYRSCIVQCTVYIRLYTVHCELWRLGQCKVGGEMSRCLWG